MSKVAERMAAGMASTTQSERPKAETRGRAALCKPDCDICGGIGYIRYDLEPHHPMFGKVQLCPNVDRWTLPYARQFGITKEESEQLTWRSILSVNGADKASKAAAEMLERGYGWLYLWGNHGLGKTLVLKTAVAAWIRNYNGNGCYARMSEVIDHLRAAYTAKDQPFSVASEERLEWWTNVPLLAIDEIERLRSTEFATEKQFIMFDRRYESALARQTMTILACNSAPSELPAELADRVYDGRFEVIRLEGQSLRHGMTWDQQ
jgi:hypothetical protein